MALLPQRTIREVILMMYNLKFKDGEINFNNTEFVFVHALIALSCLSFTFFLFLYFVYDLYNK